MAKINKTGFGKIVAGVVCASIFVNGLAHPHTSGETAISAVFFLGPASFLFYWAFKDRKAKAEKATA